MVRRPFALAFVLIAVAGPARAMSGRVGEAGGRPIAGARACILLEGADGVCASTDASGWYTLPDTKLAKIRITAPGYLPRSVAAVDQEGIIVLEPAASLRARLLDAASGEPIPQGKITLAAASGRKTGPFPVNAAGLRVATLAPGRVVPSGSAPGYRDVVGDEVDLRPGKETEIVLRLVRR